MFSPQSLISPPKKPTTITDLPPELITSIYEQLTEPSSITALNSTCRKHYQIWRSNAASISSAVIYRRIFSFPLALELLHIQEQVRDVNFTTNPPPTDRLLQIQQEARDAVLRDEKCAFEGASFSNGEYSTILARNEALISNAKKAMTACNARKWGMFPEGAAVRDEWKDEHWEAYSGGASSEALTDPFYRVRILAALGSNEAMEERLISRVEEVDFEMMMAVVAYLVLHCPDNDKLYLGVSHGVTAGDRVRANKPQSGCRLDADWAKAFLKVSEAAGDLRMVNCLRNISWGCQGNCSASVALQWRWAAAGRMWDFACFLMEK